MLSGYRDSTGIETSLFELPSELTWEQYQNYCHQPAWEETSSKSQVQVQCARLEGVPVAWEGYIVNTRVKSIKNNLARTLDFFPDFLANPVMCTLGEPHVDDCDK